MAKTKIGVGLIGSGFMGKTHALGFARRVAHTVHVMSEGVVLESGPARAVFEDPREQVTRDFLRETELI